MLAGDVAARVLRPEAAVDQLEHGAVPVAAELVADGGVAIENKNDALLTPPEAANSTDFPAFPTGGFLQLVYPGTLDVSALGIRIFGASELGARLPLALAAIGALLAVYWAGRSLLRPRAAILATLALGPDASVERTEHIVNGDRRCAYRIALKCVPQEEPQRRKGRRGKSAAGG